MTNKNNKNKKITRSEERYNAARQFKKYGFTKAVSDVFMAGASWADQHPIANAANQPDKTKETGAELISKERERQVNVEGYDKNHDSSHKYEELALAALAYANHAVGVDTSSALSVWPWDEKYFKPKDPLKDLVRAGALIAAAIDRYKEESKQ